ncbi:Starch-binding protein [Imperialibacter sp. 89]|nr:Starch-binding protein [Imperialibacter sp. 89]CAD5297323.1 Starch-binding protein [Imperialibacter sp. 75]
MKRIMKNIKKYLSAALVLVFIMSSCNEDNLIELNINKNASEEIDLSYLLAYGQLRVAGARYENWRTNLIYCSTMIQHNASLQGYWSGDKYYYNAQYSGAFMESHYTDAIKTLTHVVDQTADVPELVNLHGAATIMRSFDLHKMTDLYGNVPFFQAGRGLDGAENWFPKYDAQSEIYAALISDIKAARDGFDLSINNLGSQDILFKGDIEKWVKFANSLLMRIALRMSKVNPTEAQAVFVEAAGGAMTSNDDNAFLAQQNGPAGDTNQNGTSLVLSNAGGGGGDASNGRVSEFLVDWLTDNSDPRKMIIVGGTGDPYNSTTWNTDPDSQQGLPNGYTSQTITAINPDFESVNEYSFINREILDLDDPYPFLSYAEVELMKAEAAVKGWLSSDPEAHFVAGVTAAIESWEAFGISNAATASEISTYIVGLDFAGASDAAKLELIGEQYWAATYLNHVEAWNNWRRTGFPAFTPTSDPNNITGGTVPRRLRYYESEAGSNPDNYQSAVQAQGPDLLTTRMWWDVE